MSKQPVNNVVIDLSSRKKILDRNLVFLNISL